MSCAKQCVLVALVGALCACGSSMAATADYDPSAAFEGTTYAWLTPEGASNTEGIRNEELLDEEVRGSVDAPPPSTRTRHALDLSGMNARATETSQGA